MKTRIEEYAALSPLLAEQLRPGVITNAVLTREDYLREIASHSLDVLPFPGGLLILRQRDGFQRLNFYLQKGAALPQWQPEKTTVLEIASRPRDAALRASGALWEALGFRVQFTRQRMTRPPGVAVDAGEAKIAVRRGVPADFQEIQSLLTTYFDPVTGCLPTGAEIQNDLADGRFFVSDDAVLHIAQTASGTEIRHLLVAEQRRGCGAARSLLRFYLADAGARTSRVWVRRTNARAIRVYECAGYACDGWSSTVYRYEKGLQNHG